MGVGDRFPRPGPSIRSVVRVIIGAVSGFSSVSCLETWRIPVPRIRDRLHRIEPCSPNSHPGVEPERLSLALPKAAPEDTFAAVGVHPALGPSDTLVGVRPAHWPVPHVCGMVPVELTAASPKRRSAMRSSLAGRFPLTQHPKSIRNGSPGPGCVFFALAVLRSIRWQAAPLGSSFPAGRFRQRVDPGRAASSSPWPSCVPFAGRPGTHPAPSPASGIRPWAECVFRQPHHT